MSEHVPPTSEGKTQAAWKKLFALYPIEEKIILQGFYEISAEEIKQFREPRLMAKFDHAVNLPTLFKEKGYSILPTSRGSYIIADFDAYQKVSICHHDIITMRVPDHIESLTPETVSSEAVALHCAFASGILADFLGDDTLIPTVSGRMGSGTFDCTVHKKTYPEAKQVVHVSNAQIEIDAGFEGLHDLVLIEAKNALAEDFMIRQLYYPYRRWHNTISKKVRPVLLFHSNSIYHLFEYTFEDPHCYNSIKLVQQRSYSIEDTTITSDKIISIARNITCTTEPGVAFPQADKLERVIDLCMQLCISPMSADEITENYALDHRQTRYYADAAIYLGLVEKHLHQSPHQEKTTVYSLTSTGQQIMALNYQQRHIELFTRILSHKIFNIAFLQCVTPRSQLNPQLLGTQHQIAQLIVENTSGTQLSQATRQRRASTVRSWIKWIITITEQRNHVHT